MVRENGRGASPSTRGFHSDRERQVVTKGAYGDSTGVSLKKGEGEKNVV